MTKDQIINNLNQYLGKQIDGIASTNPLIAFTRPILKKVIDNKISSISPFLDMLKDKEGNINLSDIVSEVTTSVMDTKTFNVSVPIVGDITIGNGHIKVPIPYTDQVIVLNRQDIEELKSMLTTNN